MEPFGNGAMVLIAEAAPQAMGHKPGLPCLFCDALDIRSCLHMPSAIGIPVQYFCLEKPMDGGAWWAAVHGVPRVGHD